MGSSQGRPVGWELLLLVTYSFSAAFSALSEFQMVRAGKQRRGWAGNLKCIYRRGSTCPCHCCVHRRGFLHCHADHPAREKLHLLVSFKTFVSQMDAPEAVAESGSPPSVEQARHKRLIMCFSNIDEVKHGQALECCALCSLCRIVKLLLHHPLIYLVPRKIDVQLKV